MSGIPNDNLGMRVRLYVPVSPFGKLDPSEEEPSATTLDVYRLLGTEDSSSSSKSDASWVLYEASELEGLSAVLSGYADLQFNETCITVYNVCLTHNVVKQLQRHFASVIVLTPDMEVVTRLPDGVIVVACDVRFLESIVSCIFRLGCRQLCVHYSVNYLLDFVRFHMTSELEVLTLPLATSTLAGRAVSPVSMLKCISEICKATFVSADVLDDGFLRIHYSLSYGRNP